MMKHCMQNLASFFGNRKNVFLPVAFCVFAFALLASVVWPVVQAVAIAADVDGYQAAPSPQALFEVNAQNQEDTVSLSDAGGMPQEGELYGKISIKGTSVECNLYYGDSEAELHAGAGTYVGGGIPGQGRAVLVGGHTGTYFRDLESVQMGDDITVQTRYGEYHYEVTAMQVVVAEEFGQEELDSLEKETLLLYTCYPFGQLELTPYRYMIYADYVSGPVLMEDAT